MPAKVTGNPETGAETGAETDKMADVILCVEDEADIRIEIGEELEHSGFEVLLAANGNAALDILATETPALIICDIMMPGLSGLDLLRTIRARHRHLDGTPFLFLSALADRSHVLDGLRLGADDYLTKPVDFELLQIKVRSKLGLVNRVRLEEGRSDAGQDRGDTGGFVHFTPREKQVLVQLVNGNTNMRIAEIVGLSEHTISGYIKSIYKKLNVSSRAQATRVALEAGLVELKSR